MSYMLKRSLPLSPQHCKMTSPLLSYRYNTNGLLHKLTHKATTQNESWVVKLLYAIDKRASAINRPQLAAETMAEMLSMEELREELLECARYGEDDDVRAILQAGIEVNFQDDNGNTALHRAAANGHTNCLKVLKEFGAEHKANAQGNLPLHWAAQNGQADAVKFIIENYEVDVLEKNSSGRSALTEAFQSKNTECIEICLSHPSASEERLLPGGSKKMETVDEETGETTMSIGEVGESKEPADDSVTHKMQFTADGPIVKVRELPITRADHPFGSDEVPEDDTTGLGLWPAAVLLSRWVAQEGAALMKDKVVTELGAGCGLPGLAAAAYGQPARVFITDIHDPTLENAVHNAHINADLWPAATVEVRKVNWKERHTFPEPAQVLLGSDLVYDTKILALLVQAVQATLRPDGIFLYVAPNTGRDGMDELIVKLAEVGIVCTDQRPAPAELFENPLREVDEDQFVLHFYDLSARVPHSLYTFAYASTSALSPMET